MDKKNNEIQKKWFEYNSVNSVDYFVKSLTNNKVERVYISSNPSIVGSSGFFKASFIDDDENIHIFRDDFFIDNNDITKVVYDILDLKNISKVDGVIKLADKSNSVYLCFNADFPYNEEKLQKSYEDWILAVSVLPKNEVLLQYAKEDASIIVDVTKDKCHYITSLDGNNFRTLDNTIKQLTNIQTRDNTQAILWYQELKEE